MDRYSWLNARETRQRRAEEANRPPPSVRGSINGPSHSSVVASTADIPGDKQLDRIRLATQVSSVRDEPTPISQSQSPAQSKETSPAPTLSNAKDTTDKTSPPDETTKKQDEDRLTLSRSLYEAMLREVNDAPPPPHKTEFDTSTEIVLPKDSDSGTKGSRSGQSVREEKGIRTSDLVKMGVLPMSVAFWGPQAQMKQEQDEDRALEGGEVEGFKLDFTGM